MALLAGPAPRVFTIPPSARFLDALARALWEIAGGDPLALADIQVFLPTRRAGRVLVEALRETAPGGAAAGLIAPAIRPLGDLDADEPPFEPAGPALDAPPEIAPARRLFEIARLVAAKTRAEGGPEDPAAALAAAREIAAALDEIETAEIDDLSALDETVRANLPAHFQDAARLFEILLTAWPAWLREQGAMDAPARRSMLLRMLARQWEARPPAGPVIAAGSTGVVPAAADLLSVIARLPLGAVVLPGLDTDLDDESWSAVDFQHPQGALRRLLDRLGVARANVSVLPGAPESKAMRPRRRLIAQALLPADASGGMLAGARAVAAAQSLAPEDFAKQALSGLSLIEARTEEEEALACALAVREALGGEGRAEGTDPETVMLVTPDPALAARVSARLTRWEIAAQSSAGRPLPETAPGAFLSLLLDLAAEPASPLLLCAVWKHPLCALGRERPELRETAARIERDFLRGVRPADLRKAIADSERMPEALRERLTKLIDDTVTALAPLTALAGEAAAPDRARALVEAAEAFARTPDAQGAARVWAGEGGEASARLVADLINDGAALPATTPAGFARLFAEAAQGRVVRPRGGEHPRLRILGPLEARLQSADLVILAGLNEGVWPTVRAGEPFLSREMRAALTLDPPERRIGQAAHDFAQLAGAPRVILSRALRREGAPSVASRFLWRLKTLAGGALGRDPEAAIPAHPALGWAQALDHVRADEARPAPPPAPRPPLAARPRRARATDLRFWVRDPYFIYARDILRLRALDPVDMAPGGRERGTAVHDALESCFDALAGDLPEAALEALLDEGERLLAASGLAAEQLAFELPRFRRWARWLAETFEPARRAEGWRPAGGEAGAEWKLDAPGGAFTITARADRLDLKDGASAILDYKTVSAPSAKEVRAGFDLQMPVQAAMARQGLFAALPEGAPESLLYVKLPGGNPPGIEIELVKLKDDWTGERYADLGERVVKGLIAHFDVEANPYLSQPRAKFTNDYGDYDHLARRGEWAGAALGEGES